MAATGKVLGTVTSVVGEVKATAADGTVRVLQVGDKVYADEVINTGTLGAVNITMENGAVIDCGANTDLAMHESLLGVAAAVTAPSSQAPGTDVQALQAAIASGQDPSKIAEATAAGGQAPAAGGSEDGGAHSPVIIEQANTASVVSSGFPTLPAGIGFPSPEFQLLPTGTTPTVSVTVTVGTTPPAGSGTPTHPVVSTGATPVIEGTDGESTRTVNFVIKLDQAFDQDVTVSYQITSGPADPAHNIDPALTP